MVKKTKRTKATKTTPARARATKRAKRLVTSENFEAMLLASATQARQVARRERAPERMYTASARTIRVAEPRPYRGDDVMRVRQMLGMSQQMFASLLGTSGAAVTAWELPNSGTEPDGAAARLLEIFERHPEIAEELMKPLDGSRP